MADFVRSSGLGIFDFENFVSECVATTLTQPAYMAILAAKGMTPEQACRERATIQKVRQEQGQEAADAIRKAMAMSHPAVAVTEGKAPVKFTAHPAYSAKTLLMERPTVVVTPAYEEEKPPPSADDTDMSPRYTTTPIGPAKKSFFSFLPTWWPYALGGIAAIGGGYYVAKKKGLVKSFKGLMGFSNMTAQQERFRNAAASCKGKPGYRGCMSRKLRRG